MTKDEITAVLADLHKITGFRVSLHGADYSEIAAYPNSKCELCQLVQAAEGEHERCVASDRGACKAAIDKRGAHIYKCRYGMTEAVSPLYNFGTLTGFLMMGQVFEENTDRCAAAGNIISLGLNGDEVKEKIAAIPVASSSMIPSFVKIMTICAQYLTVSHAIPSNKPSVAHLAKEYIYLHFGDKITINNICREIGCSKSALITAFKKEYGTTINEYVTEHRLKESIHLLRQGERRIGEIALMCGFTDQSYFSKVFSARYGVPPSEWERVVGEEHDLF